MFGIVAGDQLLRGIAGLYQKYVGDNGIYGRLNADQFACMVKSGTHYTNKIFIRMNELVNAMPNGKNVGMKWGVYAVDDADLSIERMCDRALLAARSIKGQYGKYFAAYDDKLRGKLLHQQAILDSMESALAEKQFSSICSRSTSCRMGRWPARRRWSVESTRNGAFSPRRVHPDF